MLRFVASCKELHQKLVDLLRRHEVEFSIDTENQVVIDGPYFGDAYDLVIEELYQPEFGQWSILACDDQLDIPDLRNELIAKGVRFIEEDNDGEHGFALATADSPI
jgi:hypothetical protein